MEDTDVAITNSLPEEEEAVDTLETEDAADDKAVEEEAKRREMAAQTRAAIQRRPIWLSYSTIEGGSACAPAGQSTSTRSAPWSSRQQRTRVPMFSILRD